MRMGQYIRSRRREVGLSLAELSVKLTLAGHDVSKAAVGHWESGRNYPPIEDEKFLQALASALRIDTQTLLESILPLQHVEDYSPAARRAAEIIEQMPEDKREMAINVLEAML